MAGVAGFALVRCKAKRFCPLFCFTSTIGQPLKSAEVNCRFLNALVQILPYAYDKSSSDDELPLAGVAGFEPTSAGVKVPCLTAWRHPNVQ